MLEKLNWKGDNDSSFLEEIMHASSLKGSEGISQVKGVAKVSKSA